MKYFLNLVNKTKLLFIVVLLILGSLYWLRGTDLSVFTGATTVTNSFVQDQGEIQVYFCPQDDCEGALVSFLQSAQKSIDCALYEINLPGVQETLLQKSNEMPVRVVTDSDYLHKFNHSFVKTDKFGLMHNKFCIVDGEKISTGSMNPTVNDAHKNNNNLLLIHSPVLAQNYEEEFEEMWNGTFKKGKPVRIPKVTIGTIDVENYFCPEDHCADQVKEELEKAIISIYFMTFSFTHDGIAHEILLKKLDDLDIKGVMEVKQISEYSEFKVLEYQLGSERVKKDGNKYNLHHKVFIIDNACVITGSFNPTEGGDTRNDENLLIICDEKIAQKFKEEFDRVWEEAQAASAER